MIKCEICGRIRFYTLNFIFSKSVCNECYMWTKTPYYKKLHGSENNENHEHSDDKNKSDNNNNIQTPTDSIFNHS